VSLPSLFDGKTTTAFSIDPELINIHLDGIRASDPVNWKRE
jgi:hypothetical protein